MNQDKVIPENSRWTAPLVVAFYLVVSIALVIMNKIILSDEVISIRAPLFIVWLQLLISLVCLVAAGRLGEKYPFFRILPVFEFDRDIARKTVSQSIVFCCMIVFNNLCLLYSQVTFYQVARALTILFNIVLSSYLLSSSASRRSVRAALVVLLGFIIGCWGEDPTPTLAIFFGVLSSVFVALYTIYVKKALPIVEGSHWRLLYYNTVLSILILTPVMVLLSEQNIFMDHKNLTQPSFWAVMILTGSLGFLINVAIFWQIKYTSPGSHNISGTVKAVLQTVIAAIVFQEQVTLGSLAGIMLVIFGSFWYSHIRYEEAQSQGPKEQQESEKTEHKV